MSTDSFVRDKFVWLEQVACDSTLPPISTRIAILLVGFLSRGSGDAWPSLARLCDALSTSKQSAISGLKRLQTAGHLEVRAGRGRSSTSRYKPVILAAKRSSQLDHLSANKRSSQLDHLEVEKRSSSASEKVKFCINKRSSQLDPTPLSQPIEDSNERGDSPLTPNFSGNIEDAHEYQTASLFNTFWALYPEWGEPAYRASAKAEFEKVLGEGRARPDELIDGVRSYALERSAEPDPVKRRKYTARPANWLRDGRWAEARSLNGMVIDEGGNSVLPVAIHQPSAQQHRRHGLSYPEIAVAMIARRREGQNAY
jgi:hypothetical protein